jgi:hypothetical protein
MCRLTKLVKLVMHGAVMSQLPPHVSGLAQLTVCLTPDDQCRHKPYAGRYWFPLCMKTCFSSEADLMTASSATLPQVPADKHSLCQGTMTQETWQILRHEL